MIDEPHRAHVVAMFTDMTSFRSFAETADPEDVFEKIREYHRFVGQRLDRHRGRIIDFTGDRVLSVFNDPVPLEEPEYSAASAAIELRDGFAEISRRWSREGHRLALKIGMDAGFATLGRIGYEGHYSYGIVGRTVVNASIICGYARAGQILASRRLVAALGDRAVSSGEIDMSDAKLSRPLKVVELDGLAVHA